MQDTPENIKQLQHEMFMKLPQQKRLELGFDMIDEVYEMIWKNVKAQFPNQTFIEQKITFFNRFYGNDVSKELKGAFISHLQKCD